MNKEEIAFSLGEGRTKNGEGESTLHYFLMFEFE
jgi:hypothetical protein